MARQEQVTESYKNRMAPAASDPIKVSPSGVVQNLRTSMSLDKGTKEEITKKFQLHEKDTGSADVQIAILTERIEELSEHLKLNPKDNGSRLSLLKLVGQRRKLLNYLNSTDTKRYQSLCKRLELRK